MFLDPVNDKQVPIKYLVYSSIRTLILASQQQHFLREVILCACDSSLEFSECKLLPGRTDGSQTHN
jgi:hypothetical protein